MTLYPGTVITTGTPAGTANGNGKTWIFKGRWQTSPKSRWTGWTISWNNRRIIMSKRYSGKSQKDRSFMKKAKLSLKEKRKLKRERKNK